MSACGEDGLLGILQAVTHKLAVTVAWSVQHQRMCSLDRHLAKSLIFFGQKARFFSQFEGKGAVALQTWHTLSLMSQKLR